MHYEDSPETIDLSAARLERAYALLRDAVANGEIPGAALLVARRGVALAPRAFGRLRPEADEADGPIRPDTIFLVASVTKPVTVAGLMLLVERGQLALDDPVCAHIPEFAANGKEGVRIRHLMTHTSGLPDMLPEDRSLRTQHAPLDEFARRVCALGLDFEPGTRIQYQSMGILMLAQIAQRITGLPFPRFLEQELFGPLGMVDTFLGVDVSIRIPRIAHVHVPDEMRDVNWGWNTPYWWGMGAPWGGMFSTVSDIWRFLQLFLDQGRSGGSQCLAPATVAEMIRDQTSAMPGISHAQARAQAYGLGWRRWPFHSSYFGDLLSPASFGHGGATGTVVWADPARELACALFTTEPSAQSARLLGLCSNLVVAAAI
jgi:CubicO group peptidase (beta-lactamase class C family)